MNQRASIEVEKSEDEMDVVLDEAKASLMAFIEKIKKKAGVKGTESSEKTTAEKQD